MTDMEPVLTPLIIAGLISVVQSQTTIQPTKFSTAVVFIDTTTSFSPKEIINRTLPAPRKLDRISRSTDNITVRFTPPLSYRTDNTYTHFRIEYANAFVKNKVEIDKRNVSGRGQVTITGLLSGELYNISVQSQGRDAKGNYILSEVSDSIKVRTEPPHVRNIRVTTIDGNLRKILLSWNIDGTNANGARFDEFEVSYRITETLSSTQTSKYQRPPIKVPHVSTSIFKPLLGRDFTREIDIEPGATYEFSIITRSTGEDPTKSSPRKVTKEFSLPGPVRVTKLSFSDTAMAIAWELNEKIPNITSHLIAYKATRNNLNKEEIVEEILEGGNRTTYSLFGLLPGNLYAVSITCLRDGMPFGKISQTTVFYGRTAPPTPDIVLGNVKGTELTVNVNNPSTSKISSITSEFQIEKTTQTSERIQHAANSKALLMDGLTPGLLYAINITFHSGKSGDVDVTSSSASLLVRTIPNPPMDFKGVGRQGKIILEWKKPVELSSPTIWSYEIEYYPLNAPFSIIRKALGSRGGNTRMDYSLDELLPATVYKIRIYCIAGREGIGDAVSKSAAAGPLQVYTQPGNPAITKWIQITLSRVRIHWNPPARSSGSSEFYYVLNLTRVESNSSIDFKAEFLSFKIPNNETNKVLQLSYGARYRVVLTTVIEDGNFKTISVVNESNRKYFDTWSPYDSHQLISRCVWQFNSCGKSGRFGPSQVLCNSTYENSNLANLVNVKDGIQYWMAPIGGLYRITAVGAGYQMLGGKGATVSGLFHLDEGSVLKIGIGQQGMAQGGAGGTFVVAAEDENEPLLVAGGAGSYHYSAPPSDVSNARINLTAGDASEVGEELGYGGRGDSQGPGMPGLNTAGGAGYRGTSNSPMNFGNSDLEAAGYFPYYGETEDDSSRNTLPLQGGIYDSPSVTSQGGFGGGGSGYENGAGGGGGYTGGGGGPPNGYSGGGGSYIKNTAGEQYAEVANSGKGSVEITLVGLPVSSPIPVTLYLTVSFFVGIAVSLCFGILIWLIDRCTCRSAKGAKPLKNDATLSLDRLRSPAADLYEASVHVTDTSPSMSGLYVKDIGESENTSYRKFSEVDTEANMPSNLTSRVTVPPRIVESEESEHCDVWITHTGRDQNSTAEETGQENKAYEKSRSDEDTSSESTVSPVSSYKSDVDKIIDDVYAWEISDVEDSSEDTTREDDEDGQINADSEGSSLPPPPPPPPQAAGRKLKEKTRKRTKKSNKTAIF